MAQQVLSSAGAIKETEFFGNAGYGIALPSSPTDGMEYVLVDSVSAPSYQWRFRYNAGSASSYKWEFIGGSPAQVEVATNETTSSASFTALTTAGPSFTLPRAGDYMVGIGCTIGKSSGSGDSHGYMSYDIGGTAAVSADGIAGQFSEADNTAHSITSTPSRFKRKNGLSAVALVSKYYVDNGLVGAFYYRWMSVTPIRVS
jgi:hypothetical protein